MKCFNKDKNILKYKQKEKSTANIYIINHYDQWQIWSLKIDSLIIWCNQKLTVNMQKKSVCLNFFFSIIESFAVCLKDWSSKKLNA